MNESDLDKQLRAVSAPERSDEYWSDFPGRVTRELRSRPLPRPVRSSWMPQLAWGFSLAFGCFVLGYYLGHTDVPRGLTNAWQENRREMARLPDQFRMIMLDEHGLQKLVPDQP